MADTIEDFTEKAQQIVKAFVETNPHLVYTNDGTFSYNCVKCDTLIISFQKEHDQICCGCIPRRNVVAINIERKSDNVPITIELHWSEH